MVEYLDKEINRVYVNGTSHQTPTPKTVDAEFFRFGGDEESREPS
uniref:Uncharacterized protein n=1 Tax=Physcomitrium patens TaxID=3218 RepID=A0A2K1KHX9_PHYPA|nr:hypothetical protein PHYPA_007034 [Physcomitrium patens]